MNRSDHTKAETAGPAAPPAGPTKIAPRPQGPHQPNPKSSIPRILAYRWLWAFAGTAFALDQLTKLWINHQLPLGSYGKAGGIEIFPHFFYIVHVGNTGAAWSMFSGMSTALALLALATLAAIFYWRRALGLRQRPAQMFFGLLVGGTVGNLVDRLVHGHVIDFLDFHFGSYIYPTFNVADTAICLGVFGYILWSLRQPEPGTASGERQG